MKYLLSFLLLLSGYVQAQDISSDTVTRPRAGRVRIASDAQGRLWRIPATGNKEALPKLSEIAYTPSMFGAKGDGTTDDTQAFIALFKSNRTVVIPAVTYKVTGPISITGINNLSIQATGAKILSSDKTKATWLFQFCNDLTIQGGDWGYSQTITANGGSDQHLIQLDQCQRVNIERIHVLNSPELGIGITNSANVTVQHSLIEKTWRDGTYAHYSANVQYLYNYYRNVKDDAMSFHDYGLDAQKTFIAALGYSQSTNCTITGNTVENCYQGVGMVSPRSVAITGNTFKNTVLAGVAVMNQKESFTGGTAVTSDVVIERNTFENVCATTTINGNSYTNIGQGSSGRAAIVVASLGTGGQITQTEPKITSNLRIRNNTILSSGALGMHVSQTSRFTQSGNVFQDCVVSGGSLGGNVVEVWEVTDYLEESTTTITDTRTPIQHVNGYHFSGVTGTRSDWVVTRKTGTVGIQSGGTVTNKNPEGVIASMGVPTRQLTYIPANDPTSWDTYRTPGTYQVAATGAWAGVNAPTALANGGTLIVSYGRDVLMQVYYDALGSSAYRSTNGVTGSGFGGSDAWVGWQYTLIPLSKSGSPTTTEVPAGQQRIVTNTADSTTRLWYNRGGTLLSVLLN
ncbi:right-handed parallel beta-helix repeat-containing protein [Fibrella sp. ES10-3-2-2]|nr:hypothetical protein A6C57_01225 [Fibrella sp. ES10-3-2-2]